MNPFLYELFSLLKSQYEQAAGPGDYEAAPQGITGSARQFYLEQLRDNLITPMSDETRRAHGGASGQELRSKMRALHSSSAMTYNLLGNSPAEVLENPWFGEGRYTVRFEWQLPTLRPECGGLPANLDAFLYHAERQEGILCEMKMTEWLSGRRPGGLRDAYFQAGNYPSEEAADCLLPIAKALCGEEMDASGTHPLRLTQYDAAQMYKHLLAAYHGCCQGRLPPLKRLTLVNCIWELPCPERLTEKSRAIYRDMKEMEHREYELFSRLCAPAEALFDGVGVAFSLHRISAGEFLSALKKSTEERNWLKRYTF